MSDAVDTFSAERHTWNLSWVNISSGLPTSSWSETATQRSQALRHPATVKNKLRPDKTRPVSAWSKRWFRAISPVGTWVYYPSRGGSSFLEASAALTVNVLPIGGIPSTDWSVVSSIAPWKPLLEVYSDQVARTRVLNKIAQKQWDLGVTALEFKQTAGLVTGAATSLVKGVRDLINLRPTARKSLDQFFRRVRHHGDFTKAAVEVGMKDISLLERLRDGWMEYQFGVRPLYHDIADATEYLSSRVLRDGIPMLVKAKAGYTDRDTYLGAVFGRSPAIWEVRPEIEEKCSTHYSLCYEIPTGQVRDITLLGLDNPWSVAWEVVRLSWMVDYVVGVGSWLNSFTATNGMVFREGTRSTLKRQLSSTLHLKDLTSGSGYYLKEAPRLRGFFFENGSFSREVLNSTVSPAFVPQIKSRLDLVKMANSIFALSHVLGGKPGLR